MTGVLAAAIVLASAAPSCGGASDDRWTVREAESITSVRGLPVRVRECRGLGSPTPDGGEARFGRFACVAGARLAGERFDSVAVLFELRPRETYRGPSSKRDLERVRFLGGPGIP